MAEAAMAPSNAALIKSGWGAKTGERFPEVPAPGQTRSDSAFVES